MNKIVQHIWNGLRTENTANLVPVFDSENPIRNTGMMRTWYTSRPCEFTQKSHINQVAVDSTWEASEAYQLDKSPQVEAWVKNDHLGFSIMYTHRGIVGKYYPDFIIKLQNGEHLILETKGKDSDLVRTKQAYLQEWVKAVNNHGGFGIWHEAISYNPNDLTRILEQISC